MGEGFLQNSKFTDRMVEKDENGEFCKIKLTTDILTPNSQSDISYHLHAFLKPSKVFRDKSKDFKIIGEGRVIKQSIKAGTRIKEGELIILEFS